MNPPARHGSWVRRSPPELDPAGLDFGPDGLLPVVVQEIATGAVRMLAWADRAAVERTLASGEAHFWSRSRGRGWKKGEVSGNVLRVREVAADCDADALLYRADPVGPTCHTGARGCFETVSGAGGAANTEPRPAAGPRLELGWLWEVLAERRAAPPEGSYTARLLAAGVERIAQKVGEEATEVVVAALAGRPVPGGGAEGDGAPPLVAETADLLYHLLVLLLARGVDPERVAAELRRRHAAAAAADDRPAAPPEEGR